MNAPIYATPIQAAADAQRLQDGPPALLPLHFHLRAVVADPRASSDPPAPFPTQRPAMVQAATAWRETVAHRPPEPLRWHRPATLALALLLAAAALAQAVAG